MFRLNIRDTYACVLLTLFVAGIYSPLLFGGKMLFGEEQYGFYYPMSAYTAESLREGESLLWNNAYYGGVSASLDQFVGAYYPVNRFLLSNVEPITAHHLSIFLATLAGVLIAYWFGRAKRWRMSSSIALATTYLLANTFVWITIGTTAAHTFVLFPALALSLYKIRQGSHALWFTVFGGVALGISLLAGFIQIIFYAYPMMFLYAVFLDWHDMGKAAGWKQARITIAFLVMTVIGGIIGARQYLPSVFFINETIRTADYAMQHVTPLSIASLTEFLTLILPDYVAIPFFGSGSQGLYIGAVSLVFAVLALLYYRSREILFFAGLYAVVLGFAFHAPFFSFLNEHIPPYSRMGGHLRWLVAGAFPLAYLGAAGLEGFLNDPAKVPKLAYRVLLTAVGSVSIFLLLGSFVLERMLRLVESSAALQSAIVSIAFQSREMTFPAAHYADLVRRTAGEFLESVSLANPKYLFAILVWPAAFLLFLFIRRLVWLRSRQSAAIAVFILINCLGVFTLQQNLFVPKALYVEKPAMVAFLEAREPDPESYRIMGFLVGDGIFELVRGKGVSDERSLAIVERELLINNANLFWGIDRMDGLEPYRTLRHNHLLDTVISSERGAHVFDPAKLSENGMYKLDNYDVLTVVSREEKIADFIGKLPLLSMMNVKYIYSLYELESPELAEVFFWDVAIAPELSVTIHLYENRNVLPRVQFVRTPQFFEADERELLLRVASEKDFSDRSWIECGTCDALPIGSGSVSVDTYRNGFLSLRATTTSGGWLVFRESAMQGWTATVDGTEIPIYDADYLFQAVHIPQGEHRVAFEYKDILEFKLTSLR